MLATRKFSEIKASTTPNADGSITLARPAGVCKAVVIPSTYLDEGAVDCTYTPNAETKQIEVSSGETVLTLADEIGIKGDLDFEITFIDRETALIELIDGVLYNKNAGGVPFGFNGVGKLIRNAEDVMWLSIKDIYQAVADRLMRYYNVNSKEVVDYIYNATFKFSTNYTVFSKSESKRTGCYSSFRQRIVDWSMTISLGEFDFIVFEPEDKPTGYKGVMYSRPTAKSFDDMSYDEQQEYYRQQAEAEARAEKERENAYLDTYGEDFDDTEFDDYTEDDEFDGYDDDFDDFDE